MVDKPNNPSQNNGPSIENDPEDIFAASAQPNTRLTPVDTKPTAPATAPSASADHPTIELADTPKQPDKAGAVTSAPPVTPTPPRSSRKRGNKTAMLMVIAIVVILIFGGGYVALQFLGNTGGTNTVNTNTAAPIQDAPDEVDTPSDTPEPADVPIVNVGDDIQELDSDGDGLTDARENELGLDVNNADTDGDSLSDRSEVDIYFTNPFNPDTDGDGFLDGEEVRRGYDPNGPGSLRVIPQN